MRFRTASDTEVVLEAWRFGGEAWPAPLPRACSPSRCSTRPPAAWCWPGTTSASSRCSCAARRQGPGLRLRAQGAADRRSARSRWTRRPSSPRCSTTGCPRATAPSAASRSCRRVAGPRCGPDGRCRCTGTGRPVEELGHRDQGIDAEELTAIVEDSVAAPPDRRRARVAPSCPAGSTRASSPRWPRATNPAIDAYTIGFRAEDQKLEAMPDDLRYARHRRRASSASTCTRSRSRRTSSTMLPRMVDHLDEPIGDPAAINTFLICRAAREAGVKVLLSGMGADELFGGYRKHYACLLAARYRKAPAPLRAALDRRGGQAAGRRRVDAGLRSVALRQALRRPSPTCPRSPPSGAATRMYEPRRAARPAAARPGPARRDRWSTSTPTSTTRPASTTRQPHVHDRRCRCSCRAST